MVRLSPVILIAVLAAAVPLPAPRALAQCRLCATPVTARPGEGTGEDRLTLQVESALAFGRLVLVGAGSGSAWVSPDGSTGSSGAIAGGPRAVVGTVTVHGEPGRAVKVELPSRIQLYSLGGGTIDVDNVTSDLASLPRLDGAGRLTFRFGGRVEVRGDADGEFRGELPIIVEYL